MGELFQDNLPEPLFQNLTWDWIKRFENCNILFEIWPFK